MQSVFEWALEGDAGAPRRARADFVERNYGQFGEMGNSVRNVSSGWSIFYVGTL